MMGRSILKIITQYLFTKETLTDMVPEPLIGSSSDLHMRTEKWTTTI